MAYQSEKDGYLNDTSRLALGIGSGVSALVSYQGLKLAVGEATQSWLDHVVPGALACASGIMIYALWRVAFREVGKARRGLPQALAMAITALFTPGIIAVSSWFNVAGLAGSDAVKHSLLSDLSRFEASLENQYAAASAVDRQIPALEQAAGIYRTEAAGECGAGGRTGAGGDGTVCRTLNAVAQQLELLVRKTLPAAQSFREKIADEARVLLARMRQIASGPGKPDGKQVEIARTADAFRVKLAQLGSGDLAATIRVVLDALPGETAKRALSASTAAGQARQKASLDALQVELEDLGARIGAELTDEVDRLELAPIEPINPLSAVVTHADQFGPYWVMGIALDLMPLVLLLYLVSSRAVRTEAEIVIDEALDQTNRDRLKHDLADLLVRSSSSNPNDVEKAVEFALGRRSRVLLSEVRDSTDESAP